MVDFQSRDTRRTRGDDGEDETSGTDATGDDGPSGGADTDAAETDATPAETEAESQSGATPDDHGPDAVTYAVATVAAGGTLDDDPAGDGVVDVLEDHGDAVATRELLAPSYDGIQTAVDAFVGRDDIDSVVTLGGTGVEPTDVTVGAVEDLLDKHLPGFGELFRAIEGEHGGTAVVRSRATAGIVDDVPVFCLPGDPAAARRGVERIVVEEAGDIVAEASDGTGDSA